MKISVFGLGYVGSVTAACFAKIGHEVIGVDIVDYKIDAINKGKAPVEEQNLSQLIADQVKKKRLFALKETEKAIKESEISFICVGTPPKRNGDIDLSALKRVCEQIGNALKNKKQHLIVFRSTLFPGSIKVLQSVLEISSGKKAGKDFSIAYNPEFLREGSAIKDFFAPPFIIVGSENKEVCKKVLSCYKGIKSKKILVKPELAQMLKYASNSWHALKVSFANEIGSICKNLGINGKKLMGVFSEDNQLNISPCYLKPGFAYGGSCLPKDLSALKINAKKLKINTSLIDSISESNLEHINRAVKLIELTGKKKVGILGLTFKADTDDIRGNPILLVINRLLNKKLEIKIFDKLISKTNIKRINKSYRKEIFDLISRENLKEKVNSLSNLFTTLDSVLKQDIIIISNRDESLKEHLKKLSSKQIIIDLQNIFDKEDSEAKYISLT